MSKLARRVLCLSLLGLAASLPAHASPYRDAPAPVGINVSQPGTGNQVIEGCLIAAASTYHLSPVMLVILLNVEGGQLGRVSGNTNSTGDIGPMQVTESWLPDLALHWHAPITQTFLALRDNFCANVEGGAWILRGGLDEAKGDFWTGVGYYHSHDPVHKANYLHQVLNQALRLQAMNDQVRTTRQAEAPAVMTSTRPAPVRTPIVIIAAKGG